MFRKHVTSFSSAFCHDELSPESARKVGEHLMACPACHADFDEVKLGVKLARHLELAQTPDAIWSKVVSQLDQSTRRSRSRSLLKPLAIAASLLLVIGGGLLFLRSGTNQPALASWRVERLNGTPRIGSIGFSDRANLAVGQWLETDGISRAQLAVANIGNVEIDPNTRVRLVETKPTEHRLELERGRLSARISAPPKLFFVNTPSGVAEDLGCAYTLEVDDAGNSVLHVISGWVAMQLTDRESKVPAGAACATRRGVGVGTPYYEDATPEFRVALTTLDFDTTQTRAQALQILIKEARPRDALTLWYLISRVEGAQRGTVYERLVELVPPPYGVTREGVLSLNPTMLNRWRDLIENGNPVAKSITSLWTSALGKIDGSEKKR